MSGVFFSIVCPLVGALICNGMWLAPLPAVLACKKKGDLGELNPLPWSAGKYPSLPLFDLYFSQIIVIFTAYMNCIAYTTYGILRKDFFIFFANITGLCLAAFYSLVAITILARSKNQRDIDRMNIVLGVLVFGFFFYSVLGMAAGMAFSDSDDERNKAANMIGLTGCCFSIMYYMAPLTTALLVIATKDASSFYLPMIALNLTNALLWLFYGFVAIGQPAVWAPNMVGAALSLLQISLIVVYRKSSSVDKGLPLDDTDISDSKITSETDSTSKSVNVSDSEITNPILGEYSKSGSDCDV